MDISSNLAASSWYQNMKTNPTFKLLLGLCALEGPESGIRYLESLSLEKMAVYQGLL